MAGKNLLGILAATAIGGISLGNLNASNTLFLDVIPPSGFASSDVYIKHKDGATEGVGPFDSGFIQNPNSKAIEAYSLVSTEKLSTDARPTNSFSTVNLNITARGFSDSTNASVRPYILSLGSDEHSLDNKNILGCLYNVTNDVRAELLGTYDLKAMAATNGTIPLTVSNGHCYDLDVRFTPITPPSTPRTNAVITSITKSNGYANIEAIVGEGHSYVLRESTNFVDWNPVATNTIPPGTNFVNTSYSVPMDKERAFYNIETLSE